MDVGRSVVQRQQMTVMCADSSATSIFEERVSNGVSSRTRRDVALCTSLVHAHGTPSARGAENVLEPTIGSTISLGGSQNTRYSRLVGLNDCKSDETIIGCTVIVISSRRSPASKAVLLAFPLRGQYGI